MRSTAGTSRSTNGSKLNTNGSLRSTIGTVLHTDGLILGTSRKTLGSLRSNADPQVDENNNYGSTNYVGNSTSVIKNSTNSYSSTNQIHHSTNIMNHTTNNFRSTQDILRLIKEHPNFIRSSSDQTEAILVAIVSGLAAAGGVLVCVMTAGTATPLMYLASTLVIGTSISSMQNAISGAIYGNFNWSTWGQIVGINAGMTLLTFGAGYGSGHLAGIALVGKSLTDVQIKAVGALSGAIAGSGVKSGGYVVTTYIRGQRISAFSIVLEGIGGALAGGAAGFLGARIVVDEFNAAAASASTAAEAKTDPTTTTNSATIDQASVDPSDVLATAQNGDQTITLSLPQEDIDFLKIKNIFGKIKKGDFTLKDVERLLDLSDSRVGFSNASAGHAGIHVFKNTTNNILINLCSNKISMTTADLLSKEAHSFFLDIEQLKQVVHAALKSTEGLKLLNNMKNAISSLVNDGLQKTLTVDWSTIANNSANTISNQMIKTTYGIFQSTAFPISETGHVLVPFQNSTINSVVVVLQVDKTNGLLNILTAYPVQ